MDYLQQAREIFSRDIFATERTGIVIEEAEEGHALCSMRVMPHHLNAVKTVMGGAICTLADLAAGVASNMGQAVTVTMSLNINFISAAKGGILYAEANVIKGGKSTCIAEVTVKDDAGKLIARATATGFRKA